MERIIPGSTYVHYRGEKYKTIGLAKNQESGEQFVVYQDYFNHSALWVMPAHKFSEEVLDSKGQKVPRFALQ